MAQRPLFRQRARFGRISCRPSSYPANRNGKRVTAGNIAFYTLQHLKSGRGTWAAVALMCWHRALN
jgi:hypothetical protein